MKISFIGAGILAEKTFDPEMLNGTIMYVPTYAMFLILALVLFLKKNPDYKYVLITIFISPSNAIEYGGIGGRPAYPREDNTRSESIFIYENAPGSVVKDGIVIVNNTASTKSILVYATDTTPSSGGGFACKQLSEEVINEGTWYKLEKSEVTVESGKNEIVPFTLTIPDDVSVGEHNACIVVQEKKEESSNAGINLNVR
jgi:hypothetical protein